MKNTQDDTATEGCAPAAGSPVGRVEWQAANLHPCDGSGSTVRAWQLRVNGRVILNAVAMTDIHEAVTADDRKLIGQALAEYLANDKDVQPKERQ
jgi:hypothetical protein